MRPVQVSLSLIAADTDGIARTQTPSGAGDLNLNGSYVSGGLVSFDGVAKKITFNFNTTFAGKTLSVYGKVLRNGNTVSEAVAGTSSTAATTALFFEVSRISIDATANGSLTVGFAAIGATDFIPLDHKKDPFSVAWGVEVPTVSPATWTLEYTYENIWNPDISPADLKVWSDSAYTSKNTSLNSSFTAPVMAVRLKNESTGSSSLNVIQAG